MTGRDRGGSRRLRHLGARVYRRLAGRAPRTQRGGRAQDIAAETTNLGPTVDDLVVRARRRMRIGVDEDHDLVRENFDALHYLLQKRDLMQSDDVDLVDHFLRHGGSDESSPQPHFSMANYLRQHPAAVSTGRNPYVGWLERGRAAGEFADPVPRPDLIAPLLGLAPGELVDRLVARRTDLLDRMRTGTLGEMMARAAEIEPLVGAAWPAITRPILMPFPSEFVGGMSAQYRAHEAAGFRRARVVLVVNQARRTPELGMEGHLTHALARHIAPSEIVVVHTDASIANAFERHPVGVRQVDFAAYAAGIVATGKEEQQAAAERTLVTLLRTFRADAIVNIRSRLLFRAMRTYTPALTASERLFICLSGNEKTLMGTWDGWGPHYFYRTFDRVAGVITDNAYFEQHLTETYQLPSSARDRLHLLRLPVDEDRLPVSPPARTSGRAQVFWAGRWGRQRRVSTLVQLAARMPDVDFRVWAQGRVAGSDGAPLPSNLLVQTGPSDTSHLPLHEADVWLHTAEWDAVPVQLLEVGMSGVPIVGTKVGGTSEVIGERDAWPVDERAGPEAYERAIRSVLEQPEHARDRAEQLRRRLLAERSVDDFCAAAARLLLVREGAEPDD